MKIEIDLQQKWNVLKNAAMVDLDIILLLLYTEMHRLTHFNRLAETFLMKSLAIKEIAHRFSTPRSNKGTFIRQEMEL